MRTILAIFVSSGLCYPQTVGPKLLKKVDPSYSAEARRALVNASLTVGFIVGVDGIPKSVAIQRGAGFGLDAKAVEAVQKWRFEPATQGGKPVEKPASVSINVRLMEFDGTLSRLTFNPPGPDRPELLEGLIPKRGAAPDGEKDRVEFDVQPSGAIAALSIQSASAERMREIAQTIAHWKFTPVATPVHAVLELEIIPAPRSTAQPDPGQGRPGAAGTVYTRIDPKAPQDLKLGPPVLLEPADQADFNRYPRTTVCRWKPVEGAKSYLFQWDYYSDGWNSEVHKMGDFGTMVTETEMTFDFVGAQPGRWRVWPFNAKGERGVPSEWRIFRYSK
jgi:TonB family protein